MISLISPIYNEAENLLELYERVVKTLSYMEDSFELILIDNGSTDNSLLTIKELRKKDGRIKFLSLSRNFGHQGALLAGLAYASGDAVISLDGDLQHPPELIPQMIRLWKKGHEIVYTVKASGEHQRYSSFSKIFYRLMSFMSELDLSRGQSDFRLLDRKVVDTLNRIPERHKFLRGLVDWVGFQKIALEYKVEARKRGESKFSLKNYLGFALDGIFSFSTIPLRVFLWTGLLIAFLCVMYAVFMIMLVVMGFFSSAKILFPPGWATLTVSILFLGSVQLIGIGILGEYIGRTYAQTKQRPDFIVKEESLNES